LVFEQTINQNKKNDQDYYRIDFFVVLGKPVRKINIEIFLVRRRVFPCYYCDRTNFFKNEEYKTFKQNKTEADPNPLIDPINQYRISQIEYYTIEKRPHCSMDYLNSYQFTTIIGHRESTFVT
jgi:hypothetical protein